MASIGIDEVGRGCWAGPLLVVAARQTKALPEGLTDSKLLTAKKRQALNELIRISCDIGEGWVTNTEIDTLGLSAAMRLGVDRALTALSAREDEAIIMDGNYNYCPSRFTNVETVIKADAIHPVVSAASIAAKVARDVYMSKQASIYPGFGFERHFGYGTAAHLQALKGYGITPLHRKSYKPVKAFL